MNTYKVETVLSDLDQSSSAFNQSSSLAADGEYLKAVSEMMTEWYSQEDELAYADL